MNRLKIAGKYSSAMWGGADQARARCQIAEIQQVPPGDYVPGDRSSWPRSPAALKAYALKGGYVLVGKRQGRAPA
jgi:hypothetical protein